MSTEITTPIASLIRLIETLRGESGCPWDRKQTPQTLAVYLVEEVFELVDAIESGKPEDVCEELGDVLFQILFVARLFEETGHFNIDDAARKNGKKWCAGTPMCLAMHRRTARMKFESDGIRSKRRKIPTKV